MKQSDIDKVIEALENEGFIKTLARLNNWTKTDSEGYWFNVWITDVKDDNYNHKMSIECRYERWRETHQKDLYIMFYSMMSIGYQLKAFQDELKLSIQKEMQLNQVSL